MLKCALVLVIFMVFQKCDGAISDLSESEYYRMPALYGLDEYSGCLAQPTGLYCLVDVDLLADEGNELMHMIREYSAVKNKHFNHTQINRGVCVTQTCKQFTEDQDLNIVRERDVAIEKCLNESISRQYGIQAKLAEVRYCKKHGYEQELDNADKVVKNIYLLLVLLSVIGTIYDKLLPKKKGQEGNPYLMAFSIPRNWTKLTAPSGGLDPRLNRLQSFNGIRTIVMIGVIFCHAELTVSNAYLQNPIRLEKGYETLMKQLLINGPIITFSFIAMSSFLLSYNLQIYTQGRALRLVEVPKGILLRWLRLTPSYALVLATVTTYMRHAGAGPLWDLLITPEVEACREYWWAHLLYFQNYIANDVHCIPQTWYLAVDSQLFYIGLLVLVVARSSTARKVALSLLFILSLCIVAAQTYIQDLDALVVKTPEKFRSLYAHDDTFRQMYIRGHTNLSTYVLGLAAGLLAFHLQKIDNIEDNCKKYRWLVWPLLPLAVALALTGNWSYLDEGRPSMTFRVLYATFYKCIFVFMMLAFIISAMFKVESFYRGITEWRGFTWTGRVTYNAFLVHILFQKAVIGSAVAPVHAAASFSLMFLTSSVAVSYGLGALLYIFVEAPVAAITKTALSSKENKLEENKNTYKVSKLKLNKISETKKYVNDIVNAKLSCNENTTPNIHKVNDIKSDMKRSNAQK